MLSCPLCEFPSAEYFCQDTQRCYFQCSECAFIFADPVVRLTPDEEKAVYDQHQNSPADSGYRQFLNRLAGPLTERLGRKGLHGLEPGLLSDCMRVWWEQSVAGSVLKPVSKLLRLVILR